MIKSLFGLSGSSREKSPAAAGARRRSAVEAEADDDDQDGDDDDQTDNPREERRKKRQKQIQEEKNDTIEGGNEEKEEEEDAGNKDQEKEEATEEGSELSTPSTREDKAPENTPDEEDEPDHPYVGKRVRIINGPGKGTTGKLVSLKSRGWWTLEGVEGVVHSRRCMLLDKVQEDDMIAYYEKRGKKFRGTPVLDKNRNRVHVPRQKRSTSGNAPAAAEPVMKEGGAAHRTLQALDSDNRETKEAAAGINSVGPEPDSPPEKEKIEAPLLMSDLLDATTEPPTDSVFCDDIERLNATAAAVPEPWVLPAVVLEPEGNGVPAALRHLDPTDLLEIFDRKTGKILMGDDRIAVQDISVELRKHPEYEPIVPPKDDTDEDDAQAIATMMRRGRSGPNLYVNASVRPQPKRRWNRKEVIVTSGSYQGREGRIQASLPGGWYLVEGILDDATLVISPDNLETKKAEGQHQNGTHHVKKTGKVASTAVASLRTTFNEALGATIQAESTVSKTQIEALREDQHNLERQLEAVEEGAGGEFNPHRRRLQKRLDYVRNCIEKAQKDCEIEEASAKLAEASVEFAFGNADEEDSVDNTVAVDGPPVVDLSAEGVESEVQVVGPEGATASSES
eukprot:CAMPEP_0119021342 /NCGR_PEP_ID=MMETSP1176-20130426/25796_1 /TAXON_ID=265551 /ORGANISM="Synedropsis recta cf, Strain CCMP1620" /LENGTH=621 /DNA_ID=CAMNT_0006975919 /DNA_START=52 /DNA_END=1914 /DNA_ORIENTATION=+